MNISETLPKRLYTIQKKKKKHKKKNLEKTKRYYLNLKLKEDDDGCEAGTFPLSDSINYKLDESIQRFIYLRVFSDYRDLVFILKYMLIMMTFKKYFRLYVGYDDF